MNLKRFEELKAELEVVYGPHYLKVTASEPLITATGIHFESKRDREQVCKGFSDALLQLRDEIFSIYGITEIFIDRTEVVVVRKPDIQWEHVTGRICEAICAYLI